MNLVCSQARHFDRQIIFSSKRIKLWFGIYFLHQFKRKSNAQMIELVNGRVTSLLKFGFPGKQTLRWRF